MRVLLDCRMASWSGVGRYTVGLARALAARGDVDLTQVIASGERPPVAPRDGATSVAAGKHPFSLAGARELGRIAAAAECDVVHCAHFLTPMPAPHPLVVTMHDLMPLLVPGVMPSPLKRAVYRYWNARAAKRADRIITPSHATADDVEARFPSAKGKVLVTPEAADDFADGPRALVPAALVDVVAFPYVLSMGSMRRNKDLPTLLRAFARLAPSHPELRLLLVGSGDVEFIDTVLVKAPLSIRERIAFTGRVDDPQLRTLYAGAEAFVFPSRYEGFGLPPLEAMEMGTAVAVAEATSLPEVVGDAALLFAPGDAAGCAAAIERILTEPGLREHLVNAGHARAAQFTWAHTAEASVAVYLEALADRGGRR